ncbi:MAG: hypothetical protein QG635_1964, partial [Bacteroidota bacterium]|nr:hypothetical protein [Bacteroidota bacterium]
TIEISLRDLGSKVECVITDHGIGIPVSEQNQLFEMFHRFSNAKGRKGSGLGLSIVKHAIDAIDGKIEINSEMNQGTTVKLLLHKDFIET